MKKINSLRLAAAGVTAAAYATLTLILAPISFGALQFRVSEALCILPYFLPSTVWGLFIGCFFANMFSGSLVDIVFGSLATLLAGLCVRAAGKRNGGIWSKIFSCIAVTLINALVVGAVITSGYGGISIIEHPEVFALNALQVGVGEAAVMFALGLPLMLYLPRKKFFSEFVLRVNSGS